MKNLEVGKDYIYSYDSNFIVIDRTGDTANRGFYGNNFEHDLFCLSPDDLREAREEEIIGAFKKHLIHRFGEDWETMKIKERHPSEPSSIVINDGLWNVEISKEHDGWNVWNKNGLLYCNGIWVERLEEKGFEKITIKEVIKEKTAIHCETKQEAERILGMAHELGYKWCTGEGYKHNTKWEVEKSKTCYCLFTGSYASNDYYDYFKNNDYIIIPSTKIVDFEEKKTKVSKTQKPTNCSYTVLATVPYQKCPVCEGVGQIFVSTNSSIGYKPCHVCGGSGIIPMHVLPCNEV